MENITFADKDVYTEEGFLNAWDDYYQDVVSDILFFRVFTRAHLFNTKMQQDTDVRFHVTKLCANLYRASIEGPKIRVTHETNSLPQAKRLAKKLMMRDTIHPFKLRRDYELAIQQFMISVGMDYTITSKIIPSGRTQFELRIGPKDNEDGKVHLLAEADTVREAWRFFFLQISQLDTSVGSREYLLSDSLKRYVKFCVGLVF